MTCASIEPVGELGDVCRRLRALEAWWRPELAQVIREGMAEAAALPERQAQAQEAKRTAEDALSRLTPDSTRATQERWREAQSAVTREALALVSLHASEVSLLSLFGVELWRARKAKWAEGVAVLNSQEREAG